jgi:hypothetical protein
MSGSRPLALLLGPALLTACYTTTVRSGRLADPRPAMVVEGLQAVSFDARIHHGFVYGIVEAGDHYSLEHICPQGWAEVTTERDVITGLLHSVTLGLYSPQTVTIRCAAQSLPGFTPAPLYLRPAPVPGLPPPPAVQ